MATTPPATPAMTEAVSNLEDALSSRLSSLSSPSPSGNAGNPPAPAPVAAPVPAPAPAPATPASPVPAVPAAVAPASPEPATPPSTPQPSPVPGLDLSSLDPGARRYLEMHGGDPNRALSKAISDNNRLSAFYKAHPELFAPGGPLDPKAPPVVDPAAATLFTDPSSQPGAPSPAPVTDPSAIPTTPLEGAAEGDLDEGEEGAPGAEPVAADAPQVELDWTKVNASINEAVEADETCTALVRTFVEKSTEHQTAAARMSELTATIQRQQAILDDKTLDLTEPDRADRAQQVREARSELLAIRHEKLILEQEMRSLDGQFRGRKHSISESIAQREYDALRSQAQEKENAGNVKKAYQELTSNWEPTLIRVAQTSGIDPRMLPSFRNFVKREAIYRQHSDATWYIRNLDAFMMETARSFLSDLDNAHRVQSAHYAGLAAARATSPTPAPSLAPGTPAPPLPAPPATLSPEAATESLSEALASRFRR